MFYFSNGLSLSVAGQYSWPWTGISIAHVHIFLFLSAFAQNLIFLIDQILDSFQFY